MSQTFGKISFGLALALATTCVLRFAEQALLNLRCPYQLDYGEGGVLASMVLLAEHGHFYLDIAEYPFIHGLYPPVFAAVSHLVGLLLGDSLFVTRLVSTVATLLLALELFLWARLRTKAYDPGLLAASLLLAFPAVHLWGTLGRVDMLAMLFSLSALLSIEYFGVHDRKGRHLAHVCLLLAFFTKQNTLALSLSLLLCYLFERERKQLVLSFLASYLIPLVLICAALNQVTDGQFYRHLVTYVAAAPMKWNEGLQTLATFSCLIPLVLFDVTMIVKRALQRAPTSFKTRLVTIYFVVATLTLVEVAKAGSSVNFLIEPALATILLAVTSLDELQGRTDRSAGPSGAVRLAAVLGVGVLLILFSRESTSRYVRQPGDVRRDRVVYERIRSTTGDVLSEDLTAVLSAGKTVLIEPFSFIFLASAGLWSPRPLVEDCKSGRFKLIAVTVPFPRLFGIPGMRECVNSNYHVALTTGDMIVYEYDEPSPMAPTRQS